MECFFGKDFVVSFSQKQKLNSNRSIESELICDDNELPYILWSKYFINLHGYTVNFFLLKKDDCSKMCPKKLEIVHI